MSYKVSDMVVYPRHGAAKVEAITERTVKGVTREYLQLSVLSSDGLVISVPVDNAKKVGVRDIVSASEVAKVFGILRTPIIEKEMNWSRRYKLNVEKIATGDVNKIAEVVRDLAQRDVDEHGLSTRNRRMLTKARAILTSEIALSEKIDEAEAQRLLDVNLGYEPAQPGDDKHHLRRARRATADVYWLVFGVQEEVKSDLIVLRPRSCPYAIRRGFVIHNRLMPFVWAAPSKGTAWGLQEC